MRAHELLADLQRQGFALRPLPGGKLEVKPASKLTDDLRATLKQRKAEVLTLLTQQSAAIEAGEHSPNGKRDFLSRPLGQEDNPSVWDAWAPFFDWLREHHPARFFAICEVEESIRTLERQGITEGRDYEAACQELTRRFEAARRLKLKETVKVWLQ